MTSATGLAVTRKACGLNHKKTQRESSWSDGSVCPSLKGMSWWGGSIYPSLRGVFLVLWLSMPSLRGMFVVLRFSIPVVAGIVLGSVVEYSLFTWNVRGLEFRHAHHWRERFWSYCSVCPPSQEVCGPMVQYVRRYKKCPWSWGSVCTSLQGALLVIRSRMPMSKGKFLIGLIVEDSHLYMEFPGLNGSRCPSLRGEEIIALMKAAQRKVTGLCSCYIFRIMPLEGALISSRNAKSFVFTDDQQQGCNFFTCV